MLGPVSGKLAEEAEVRRKAGGLLKALLISIAAIWAVFMAALAIFHTWQVYNPVPRWDMWVGYLGFYQSVLAGHYSVWWEKWFEHCILLDRILFWLDLRLFSGSNIFLLVMNYVLAGCCAAVFWAVLKQRTEKARTTTIFLGLLSTGALFMLCQGENLTWAFQGQFWFAYLMPFCALYWLQKSLTEGVTRDFLIACAFGVSSAGSMGNGAAALPLMLIFALLTRQRKSRIAVLLLLVIPLLIWYTHSPGSLPIRAFMSIKAVQYWLIVLGSPALFVISHASLAVAEVSGVLFLAAAGYKLVKVLLKPRGDALQAALEFFIGYVCLSAIAIACVRLPEQLQPPLSHYLTIPIMGWIALGCSFAPQLASLPARWKVILAIGCVPFLFMSTTFQVHALDNWDQPISEWKGRLVGVVLGADDTAGYTDIAGPGDAPKALPLGQKAYDLHLGIFARFPYAGMREELGTRVATPSGLAACEGSIDGIETITDNRFLYFHGQLMSPAAGRKASAVRVLESDGTEVGYAVMGQTTWDSDKSLAARGLDHSFRGYVLSKASGHNLTVQGEDKQGLTCGFNAVLPERMYVLKTADISHDKVTVASDSVVGENEWTGSDADHTDMVAQGLRVFGTYTSKGDSDKGSVSLRVKRGDRLLYRSGPAGGHQYLEVTGLPRITLPVAQNWMLLDFSSLHSATEAVTAKFTDAGTGWGEWSAIALSNMTHIPFSVTASANAFDQVTVTARSVQAGSEWTGADSFHTDLCPKGLQIMGSFKVHGDVDSGAITLMVKRGDRVLYRSGPAGGHQLLSIAGNKAVVLPVALEWVLLDFAGSDLPAGQFRATFTDAGTGWGEWSAIAVEEKQHCQSRH